jgi:hypothetical protein
MEKIDMNKDLENFQCCWTRDLAYYLGWWYENENKPIEKIKLYKIYKYLIDVKPEIQDLFSNEIYYDDILKILDIYKEAEGDSMGGLMLMNIKLILIEKKIEE